MNRYRVVINDPSNSKSWKVLETVSSPLKRMSNRGDFIKRDNFFGAEVKLVFS